MAVGAAMTGLRPVVDLTVASFTYLASDQIINQASKLRYMTGGQMQVPAVFRCCMYYNLGHGRTTLRSPLLNVYELPRIKNITAVQPLQI